MVSLRTGVIFLAALLAVTSAPAQQQGKSRVYTNDDIERSAPAPSGPAPSSPAPEQRNPLLGSGRVATAEPAASRDSLLSTADSVLAEMSQLTGLGIRSPLRKRVVNREEMRKVLEDIIRAEYTPQMIHVQEATLKAFGIVTPEFDLKQFMISFFSEQAAGLYDARSKTMYLADWVEGEMQGMVLRHELTHALQDQNFDLDRFLRADISNDDATAARQAVTEGYATAAMFQGLLGGIDLSALSSLGSSLGSIIDLGAQLQMTEMRAFLNAPFALRFQALFPYTQGAGFIQQGLAQGGWAGLNNVFRNPPKTTREIFNPELYFGRNTAGNVAVTPNLPHPKPLSSLSDLHFVTENTMGELGYYSLVGQFVSEEEAAHVGTGLLGDRYLVYENPAARRYALVGVTRWTSPEAAFLFFRRYLSIVNKKYQEITPDRRSTSDEFIGSSKAGAVLLLRKGNECVWAEGVPAGQTDAMLDYLRSIQ